MGDHLRKSFVVAYHLLSQNILRIQGNKNVIGVNKKV